jgi:hypothetical protein
VILPPRENITIITQTTNITNVVVRNNIIVNEGPDYNVIVRQTSQPIRRLKLERQTDIATDASSIQGDGFRSRIHGDTLAMPAPRFQAATGATPIAPRKVARRVEAAVINHGWKDAGDAQKVESFRNKLQAEAKPPANLPPVKKKGSRRERAPQRLTADRTNRHEADTSTRPPGPGRDARTPGECLASAHWDWLAFRARTPTVRLQTRRAHLPTGANRPPKRALQAERTAQVLKRVPLAHKGVRPQQRPTQVGLMRANRMRPHPIDRASPIAQELSEERAPSGSKEIARTILQRELCRNATTTQRTP